jgi:hypothetical protein
MTQIAGDSGDLYPPLSLGKDSEGSGMRQGRRSVRNIPEDTGMQLTLFPCDAWAHRQGPGPTDIKLKRPRYEAHRPNET